MSEHMDYWPSEIAGTGDPDPVKLMKEQAALLGGRTGKTVEGVVRTSTEGGTVYYSLYLKADALGDYLYKILYIAHPAINNTVEVYPITAQSSTGGPKLTISSQTEFEKWLHSQLSSDYVRRAIGDLLRYVRESRMTQRAS